MILKNVESLLSKKEVVKTTPFNTVRNACVVMADANLRALPVVSDGKLEGILSEKDVVHKCVAKGLPSDTTEVRAIMTTDIKSIEADDTVAHAIEAMTTGQFHHLPVLKEGKVIGMIYSDDIPEEYKLLLEHYHELTR